ncbi:MAG: hypothetical protein IPK71_04730 [Myxococcales bacterium]|nr:hypothetical protein [Myxococcales bacterium]
MVCCRGPQVVTALIDTGVLLVPAPCKNGICGSSKDVCVSACEDKGGWSGRADENW